MRLLIVNGYAREGRDALQAAGATAPELLYRRLVERLVPECGIDVLFAADADAQLPPGVALAAYDGMVWTGSSLTIHANGDERVTRQVALARAAYDAGVPAFGSCWAAQIAVTAAGGRCAPSARGREFGVAAPIRLTAAGRDHPLYRGKADGFAALTSHADEVVELPAGATLLASNAFSRVQAVALTHGRGTFWAVQYHPEYDLHEIARLAVLRRDELVRQGTFADEAAAAAWIAAFEALHADPRQEALAVRYGVAVGDIAETVRLVELANWIDGQVRPRAAA